MSLKLPTMTIANGTSTSDITIDFTKVFRRVRSIVIYAPATLPETVTVEVAENDSGTFKPLQSNGTDVTLTAGKATPITNIGFGSMKLVSTSGNVAVDRVFTISGAEFLYSG